MKFKTPIPGDLVRVITYSHFSGSVTVDITGLLLRLDVVVNATETAWGHIVILDDAGVERPVSFRTYDGDSLEIVSSYEDVE